MSEGTITIKKQELWKYSTFLLLIIFVIEAFVIFGNKTDTVVVNNPTPTVPTTGPTEPSQVRASVDDDPVLGDKNAKVTIIEFSDYQCPFCERFYSETLPQIKKEYIDTGKVKLVYRDFPLDSIHPMATPAALAAECVREKGKDAAYFKMHDKIFENQQQLSESYLKSWAKELGYNIDDCLDSKKFMSEVRKDLSDAQASGGRGTPYFVILGSNEDGTPVSGAQPFPVFKQIIDSKLS